MMAIRKRIDPRQRLLFDDFVDDHTIPKKPSELLTLERGLRASIRFWEGADQWGVTFTDFIPEDLSDTYADGGKWVGRIPRDNLREKKIREIDMVRTARRSGHGRRIGLYVPTDPAIVASELAVLRLQLDQLLQAKKEAGESDATNSPAEQSINHLSNGA